MAPASRCTTGESQSNYAGLMGNKLKLILTKNLFGYNADKPQRVSSFKVSKNKRSMRCLMRAQNLSSASGQWTLSIWGKNLADEE